MISDHLEHATLCICTDVRVQVFLSSQPSYDCCSDVDFPMRVTGPSRLEPHVWPAQGSYEWSVLNRMYHNEYEVLLLWHCAKASVCGRMTLNCLMRWTRFSILMVCVSKRCASNNTRMPFLFSTATRLMIARFWTYCGILRNAVAAVGFQIVQGNLWHHSHRSLG